MMKRLMMMAMVAAVSLLGACQSSPEVVHTDPGVQPAQLGSTERVHVCQNVLLASQPSAADFDILQQRGYRSVLNLRGEGEDLGFDERQAAADRGITYHHVGFSSADQLTDEVFGEVRQILSEQQNHPILVHCASANRVGAVWLAHRVLDDGLEYENALAEAKTVGLRSPGLEERARAYIYQQRGHGQPVVN